MHEQREQDNRTDPIVEDMSFQRAAWTIERIAWIVLLLVAVAALCGVTSRGFASYAIAHAPDGPAVHYERFERETRSVRFLVQLTGHQLDNLHLDQNFLDSYAIQSIHPHPKRSQSGGHGLDLTFSQPSADGGAVVIQVRPRRWGLIRLRVADERGATAFRVFVYP